MEEVTIDNFSEDSFEMDPPAPEPVTSQTSATPAVLSGGNIQVVKANMTPVVPMADSIKAELELSGGADKKQEDSDIESISSEDSLDSQSTSSTVDCLSRDPLFLVLSKYLANDQGNIVDALYKINKTLKKILKVVDDK